MTHPHLNQDDPLDDFFCRQLTFDGIQKPVYMAGAGPAVIVMCEMPGISPQVARFARWVRDAGLTVYMPSLFGRPGAAASAQEAVDVFKRACISAEFRALAGAGDTPIVGWLRQLATLAHEECGGPGVGAVGMCFTGNFALALMLDEATIASVVCQPSLPLEQPDAIGLSANDVDQIRVRLERRNLMVTGYRFAGDKWCTAERFSAYQRAFGPRFVGHVLPDSAANSEPPPFFKDVVVTPHSVVRAHLIDEAGQPTLAARDDILRFLQCSLLVADTLVEP